MKNIILQVFIGICFNLITILCIFMPAHAQKTLLLSDQQNSYSLGMYLEFLEDPEGNLSINDVTSTEYDARFVACNEKVPNFGFTKSVYWVRFRVVNGTKTNICQWRLSLGFANIHYIDLYKPAPNSQSFDVIQTGMMRPLETKDVPFHRFVFKLSLPLQTEQIIFLRFKNSASMTLPMTLLSTETFNQESMKELFFLGLFSGILIIMIVYNLFLFISLRDKSYLYYTLSVFTFLVFVLSQRGLAYQYLWPNLIWWNHLAVPLFNALLLICILIFTDTFLLLKASFYKLHQIINALLVISVMLTILVPFTNYGIIIQPIVLLSLFIPFIILIAGFRSWRQGYQPARYFLFGIVILIITGIITALTRLGLFPSNFFTEYGPLFGIIFLVGLLSLALVDRINLLKTGVEKINKELVESEKKYRYIFENIQDVYYEINLDGTIIEISPSVEYFSLYKRDELIGKPISLFYTGPSIRKKFLGKVLKSDKVYDFEIAMKNKDKSLFFVSANSVLLRDEQGEPLKVVGSLRNIDERKKLEEQLLQVQKMESVGILAGGIAHDFNNLLTIINGNAELVLMKIGENHPILNKIHEILKAGRKAGRLTRQLLAFSRKEIIKPKILDINNVISNLDTMLQRLIEKDISIEMILATGLPKIKADPTQIEQVLINLIINARDAIIQKRDREDTRKITVETSLVFLDELYASCHLGSMIGYHNLISVSDSGHGISEKIKNNIFDPFFTTKELGRGTGLGLATVFGIVKQNKGSIEVYSKADKGTTIKIYWPSTDKEIVSEIEKGAVKKDDFSGHESILLTEDDEGVRNYAKTALTNFGYHVYEAQNGTDALKLIKVENIHIDMLVTDLIMPGINGKELSLEIKKIFPKINTLYVSGYTNNYIIEQGILEKGVYFLHKPYTVTSLVKSVRKILDNA